jgi:predicted SprT family Zn-dependent metalloprotease
MILTVQEEAIESPTSVSSGNEAAPPPEEIHAARELWMYRIAEALYPRFAELKYPDRPSIRIGVGYPTTGARGKAIGQCHNSASSRDKVHEITISPRLDESIEVAGVVAHELCHAYLFKYFPDENCGHGKKFRNLATAIGLTGKMRSTACGEAFTRFLEPVLISLGEYPHGALRADGLKTRRVQSTRMKKVYCPSCEYLMRVTQKWIETAIPRCPSPVCELFSQEMEVV